MDISQEFRERVLDGLERLERQLERLERQQQDQNKDISDLRVGLARVEQKLDDTLAQRKGRWVNVGIVAAVVGVIVSLIKSFFFS